MGKIRQMKLWHYIMLAATVGVLPITGMAKVRSAVRTLQVADRIVGTDMFKSLRNMTSIVAV